MFPVSAHLSASVTSSVHISQAFNCDDIWGMECKIVNFSLKKQKQSGFNHEHARAKMLLRYQQQRYFPIYRL